jgi:hypothetical protein
MFLIIRRRERASSIGLSMKDSLEIVITKKKTEINEEKENQTPNGHSFLLPHLVLSERLPTDGENTSSLRKDVRETP